MLRIGAIAGSSLVGLALLVFAQESPIKGENTAKKPETRSRTELARKALAERIEIPEGFRRPGQPVLFREVLAYIADALGERKQSLDINFDEASFKEGADGDDVNCGEMPITFPPSLRSATVQDMLEL